MATVTGSVSFFLFLVELGFELRALHLPQPSPFYFGLIFQMVSHFCLGLPGPRSFTHSLPTQLGPQTHTTTPNLLIEMGSR
jgi:hypothetical protein